MTTVYTDYYNAYDKKLMDITNVSFLAMLVDETYIPNGNHTIDDVNGVIISVPFVLIDNDIVTLSMSEIIDKATYQIKDYMSLYPEEINKDYLTEIEPFNKGRYVTIFNPDLNILCFTETINEMA